PPGDQRDWTQCQHCGKTPRHFVGGVKRAPPAHAVSSDIDAVGIHPAVLYHVVEHSRERIDISPNFSRRTLRRDHNERELRIGFSDFRRAEALHLVDVIAAKRTAMEIEKEWISIRSGRIAPGQRYQVLHPGVMRQDLLQGVFLQTSRRVTRVVFCYLRASRDGYHC